MESISALLKLPAPVRAQILGEAGLIRYDLIFMSEEGE
jgi:hypothetical protein